MGKIRMMYSITTEMDCMVGAHSRERETSAQGKVREILVNEVT